MGAGEWQTRGARCQAWPNRWPKHRSAVRPIKAGRSRHYRYRGEFAGNMSAELIRFENVTKVYGHGEAAVVALDRINISIGSGEFVAVLGPSGSGKSTAMNILGCLDTPTSGHYHFYGIDLKSLTRDQLALVRRNYFGFVFQGFNLLKRTSALENLELPLIYRGMPRKQ